MKEWEVVQGDCLKVLAGLPDESVDMIWTDPPYGNSNAEGDLLESLHEAVPDGRAPTPQEAIANDDPEEMRAVVDGMLTQAARVLRRDASVVCCCCGGGGGDPPVFSWVADRMNSGGLRFFQSVIWDKKNPGLGWRYRRQHEMVMVAHPKGARLRWANPDVKQPNIIAMSKPKAGFHPNEKPVELVRRFIELHTHPGDLVVDPFCGSGTTGVACIQTGRRFLGIELDPGYCEVSRRRLEGEAPLFAGPAAVAENARLFAEAA